MLTSTYNYIMQAASMSTSTQAVFLRLDSVPASTSSPLINNVKKLCDTAVFCGNRLVKEHIQMLKI